MVGPFDNYEASSPVLRMLASRSMWIPKRRSLIWIYIVEMTAVVLITVWLVPTEPLVSTNRTLLIVLAVIGVVAVLDFVALKALWRSIGKRLRGTGTVFIAWCEPEQDHYYSAYWDAAPDHRPALLEQAPDTDSIEVALRWGRERTPRVLIRPESDPGEYYWAGIGEPQGSDADLKHLAL